MHSSHPIPLPAQPPKAYNRERVQGMNRVNPKFCLRNYMAQAAFEKAKTGDYSELAVIFDVCEPTRYATLPICSRNGALDVLV